MALEDKRSNSDAGNRLTNAHILIGLLGLSLLMPSQTRADPIRHCSAAYIIQFKSVSSSGVVPSVRMGVFRATSRCARRAPDVECRKMARGRAHACMSSHWNKRGETPPDACSGRLDTYPAGRLNQRLIEMACSSRLESGQPTLVVNLLASTFGAPQCMGDALLAEDIKIDCREKRLFP